MLTELHVRGHVFEHYGSLFGASEGGCTVGDARVLVVTDRRGLALLSSLDAGSKSVAVMKTENRACATAQCGAELNATYVPHDEAVFGLLRCSATACRETLGLDRVSCRDNSREVWLSTTKTRCGHDDYVPLDDDTRSASLCVPEPSSSAAAAAMVVDK